MKWAVGMLLVVAVLIGVLAWLPDDTQKQAEFDSPTYTTPQPSPPVLAPSVANSAATGQRITPTMSQSNEPVSSFDNTPTPDPLAAAMESMRNSLNQPDPRTPPLAKDTQPEPGPSDEVLSDPSLYLQWEAEQSAKIASVYLTALQDIPMLQDMIHQAKATGSRTAEEIRDAEEALEQMIMLRDQLEKEHPGILEQLERGEYPTE